jgi:hypothetical protein
LTTNVILDKDINAEEVRKNNEYDHAYFLFRQRHTGFGKSDSTNMRFPENTSEVATEQKVDSKTFN